MITNDTDYSAALTRLETLMAMDRDTRDCPTCELNALAREIHDYEEQVYPTRGVDPIDAIRFRMEQQGLKQVDLVQYIGSRPKVSEVLNRKRGLSMRMIRNLHRGLGIPLASLVGE